MLTQAPLNSLLLPGTQLPICFQGLQAEPLCVTIRILHSEPILFSTNALLNPLPPINSLLIIFIGVYGVYGPNLFANRRRESARGTGVKKLRHSVAHTAEAEDVARGLLRRLRAQLYK